MNELDEPSGRDRVLDRGVARRQAFLAAAREVFLEHGYEAASVNDVVRLAGGSLATLYSQFGSKEGLFLAVAQEHQDRAQRELVPDCVDDLPLEQGLTVIGEHWVSSLLSADNLAYYRIVVGEGRKFPEQVQRSLLAGADKMRSAVAGYLEKRSAQEGRPIADPEAASQYFMGLLRSRHQYSALADPTYSLTSEQLKSHVRASVAFFLNGALPR